jgi:tripartite-type tricarboxylate transporter receptor subunit TctC
MFPARSALAQDGWPTRPVRVVVPSSAGGATDFFARLLGQRLSEVLMQPFVVENRGGANGIIGAEMVAKAAPDGYTIMVSASPVLVINPSFYKDLSYDPERDFVAVARGVISPLVWVTSPTLPVRTLADLIALGRRDPGKVPYGSAGSGSLTNLGVRLLEEATGAKFIEVPYKGLGVAAFADLLGGNIKFVLSDIGTARPHIESGQLLAIAVTDRISQLPDVPSVAESGYANAATQATFSVVAPAGTPPSIVHRLNVEINSAMKLPAVAARLEQYVLLPVFDSPESFTVTLRNDREKWAAFIKRNGMGQNSDGKSE